MLIIDGNSVYEIDEECARRTHPGFQLFASGFHFF